MGNIITMELPDADLANNDEAAEQLREDLKGMGIFMINVLGTPGCGRTALMCQTIKALRESYMVGAMCAAIDTQIDAEKIADVCDNVVQLHASGMEPFITAEGARGGLMELLANEINVVMVENVGGLFSPVVHDTGANMNVAVMSVAEGDSLPLKYSFMFAICDVVVITKTDLLGSVECDLKKLRDNILSVNENATIFGVSAKTGDGIKEWSTWLIRQIWSSL